MLTHDKETIMWKLHDGRVTQGVKTLVIGDTQYSGSILNIKNKDFLATLNIFPFKEVKYDSANYKSIGAVELMVEGWIIKTHTTEPRKTVADLRKQFGKDMRQMAKQEIIRIRDESTYFVNFEPESEERAAWSLYREAYKVAFKAIKAELLLIDDYKDTIEFIQSGWQQHMPSAPDNEVM
jgi:hypothetical protein